MEDNKDIRENTEVTETKAAETAETKAAETAEAKAAETAETVQEHKKIPR